jgi:hypothetical protein
MLALLQEAEAFNVGLGLSSIIGPQGIKLSFKGQDAELALI